ncbi:MAG: pyridoxamine 5'-phosphate oxidase family protein [Thiolinea sp.]
MSAPLAKLRSWVNEERLGGNPFSHGAVLGSVDAQGQAHTRMLGVHFDAQNYPRFHTSPTSRKVADLAQNPQASLTFAFQTSFRSVSLEGRLAALSAPQLDEDWLHLESAFRRSYLVFGKNSGQAIQSEKVLSSELADLAVQAELIRPAYFIGYIFVEIQRIAFYSVGTGAFAEHELWVFDHESKNWKKNLLVP